MAEIQKYLEPDDSFFIGADVYYTYIVQNGWWELRLQQKSEEGYFSMADSFREKLLHGVFPSSIEEEFVHMLEYFGQSPVIVRSSSLQEDNFGNAFAGKYESVFCVNQGTPQERLRAFEDAVRRVYASTMNPDALQYRCQRGLALKMSRWQFWYKGYPAIIMGIIFFHMRLGWETLRICMCGIKIWTWMQECSVLFSGLEPGLWIG